MADDCYIPNWERRRAQMLARDLRSVDPAVRVTVNARRHTATITLDLTLLESLIERLGAPA
jgi:hypothetical protein